MASSVADDERGRAVFVGRVADGSPTTIAARCFGSGRGAGTVPIR
jgi:hypothetical protein